MAMNHHAAPQPLRQPFLEEIARIVPTAIGVKPRPELDAVEVRVDGVPTLLLTDRATMMLIEALLAGLAAIGVGAEP